MVFTSGLLEVTDEEGNVIEDADLDLPPEGEELTITDSNGDTWVVDSEGGVSGGPVPGIQTETIIDDNKLEGLDQLVYELIEQNIEDSQTSISELIENMEPFIKEIEQIISTENYYPPRIRGENDELIGEGISLYIAPIEKPESVQARLTPPVRKIDNARNNLIELDIPIQKHKKSIETLNKLKEEDEFEKFVGSIKEAENLPDDVEEKKKHIQSIINEKTGIDKE